ncbi:transmembrane protein 44 isoform X2 [Melanotaenia boesemani]|uniref:transmembrane protein 44 isoform X2 n=1 Tax=Melanotaenia boesemani TaxID=1250792 RepID=UPI001C03E45B|nr:transmembrane protein 44 isoform X2 [Melanotaenia boesemani]
MERRRTFSGGLIKGNSDSFLVFSWDDAVTCFTHDAAKLCVPVYLTFLSALLLLLSCLLVLCPRFKFRGEFSGDNIMVFYCFLGNLCSTVGAVLSRQLHLQVFMGAFAAVMDAINSIMCCLPVFLCWNSTAQRKQRMVKRRRRQHLLAVGVLMVVAGGFLKSRITDPPVMKPASERRLLRVLLQVSSWSPLMENNEILGYILGLLSLVIACTSRFPALCRARRGQKLSRAYIFSRLLCSLSGALYTAAILLCGTRFEFLMRVMPWLLSSIGCIYLDLLILVITWCKRGNGQRSMRFSPDTESLLGGPDVHGDDPVVIKRQIKKQIPSSAQAKYSTFSSKTKNVQKMTEMGHYMDVSVQPARKQKSLKEVTLSADGAEDRPLQKMVRVIRVDSLCSSDTSYDSSPISSDLEWDFGAAVSQWSKPATKPQEGDEFPLQDWPTNPKPLSICMQPPQKTLSAADECGSVVS